MSESGSAVKKSMTDEERLELCQKLDKELDDFINNLEHKRYTEGWPEDKWEEEMEKHPFFMKNLSEGDDVSPLAEGLAKLKYDPEENTPLELAISYKEDGNFNFKHKNYRLAILGYTEGIKSKCDDAETNASLYNNRAASNWYLKNYRTALYDSEKALFFNPNHTKARLRAAKAAFEFEKYDKCIEHSQKLLEIEPNNKEAIDLLKTAKKRKPIQERDQRKKEREKAREKEEKDQIIRAILERGIKVADCEDDDDVDLFKLEPTLPRTKDAVVYIKDGTLMWPVLVLYPEYKMTDLLKGCPENVSLVQQLDQLFPAHWDENNKYSCSTINVYFEGRDFMPHVIDTSKKLGDLLVLKDFELKAGTPSFYILPRGSAVERRFLEDYI